MAPNATRPERIGRNGIESEIIVLGGDAKEILAPQEALGPSILESTVTLIKQSSSGIFSRIEHAIRGDTIDILPDLTKIYERVQGCHVIAGHDVGDVGKTSLLILKFLTRINSHIQTLSSALRDPSLSSKARRRALLDFQSVTKTWLVDTVELSSSNADETEGNTSPPRMALPKLL